MINVSHHHCTGAGKVAGVCVGKLTIEHNSYKMN